MAEWITAIGTMLAGLAAVTAVALGFVTAKSWRAQARAAKEAEVAGEALVAVVQHVAVLHRMLTGYRTVPDLAAAVHARWSDAAPTENALKAVAARATAYLPEAAVGVLFEVLDHGSTLYADQWGWGLAMDAGESSPNLFEQTFGNHRRGALRDLEKNVIATLKPLARVDG